MNLTAVLQAVRQHYHFHIYHTVPVKEALHLETNCGAKKATVWTDEQELHWSFLWREEAKACGLRSTDRFIRTKDGAPFVKAGETYVVVQDLPYGQPLTLARAPQRRLVSEYVARLYVTFRALSQKLSSTDVFGVMRVPLRENRLTQLELEQEIRRLRKKITLHQPSAFIHAVQQSWRQIELRWKRSSQLFMSSPPPFLGLKRLEWDWFWESSPSVVHLAVRDNQIGISYRALVRFWTELLLKTELELEDVGEMIDLFLARAQVTRAERWNILAEMIHPDLFLRLIERYFQQVWTEEECLEAWLEACARQDQIDRLVQWYAERLDLDGKDVAAQ